MKNDFCLKILFSTLLLFTPILSADTECKYAPQNIEDRRVDKNTFRVVQYNVEWLFIDEYNNTQCPGSGCTWANQSEALKHMDYVWIRIQTRFYHYHLFYFTGTYS